MGANDIAASPSLNVLQRINAVRQRVEYLKKEKKVESYMAVTHDQVTDFIRDALIEFGLVVFPSVVPGTSKVADTGTFTAKKVPFIRYEAEFDVAFCSIDDPQDRVCMRVPAHAIDHGDKAPGKAISYATKAAELKMFNIVTGEIDDEQRPKDQTAGMTLADFAEWEKQINAITTKAQIDPLWKKITEACQKLDDSGAYTRLRAVMSVKNAALKKQAATKQPEAAHA